MREFKLRQACLFFIAFVPVTKVFLLPSIYAGLTGSDMWISALLNLIADTFSLLSVLLFWKRFDGMELYDVLTQTFGKAVAKITYMLYFIYFILKAYIPLAEQKGFIEITLYENTAGFLVFSPLALFAAYLAVKKARVLGRTADILALVTLSGVVLLSSLSVTNADFGSVLPFGVNGAFSIAKASYYALPWFGDAVYFMFLTGEVKPEKGYLWKTLTSYFVSGLLVVFFMLLFYATFSSIAQRQSYALTEISKYSTVIYNIGRFDYIGIFSILLSGIFALSLPIYFASLCFRRVFEVKRKLILSAVLSGIVFFAVISTQSNLSSVQNIIQTYLGGFTLILSNVLPVSLLFVRRKNEKNVKG